MRGGRANFANSANFAVFANFADFANFAIFVDFADFAIFANFADFADFYVLSGARSSRQRQGLFKNNCQIEKERKIMFHSGETNIS